MSAKKMTDTKVPEDDNIDSGFLSGPLSEDLLSSTDLSEHSDSNKVDKVVSDGVRERERDQDEQIDSGLDLCVSECLSERLDYTPTAVEQIATEQQSVPAITVNDDKNDVPPLGILFLQDDDGDTQLHIAAVHGCQKSVSTLVKLCPNKLWLNIPNDYGHTALHLAVMSGHPVVTRMLVLAGATLDVRDHSGETPLHVAISYNQKDCLQSLLNPVEGRRISQSVLNQKNYDGQTCVHLAATKGLQECLQILVFHGADVNAKEGLAGRTALHIAARAGNLPLTKYLLERCPGVDRFARDFAGRSPRRLAARSPASRLFAAMPADSDSDSDDEMCQCMEESLFDSLRKGFSAINVA